MLKQMVFDLTKLDPITANFHLVVEPSQVFDIAIRQQLRQIACPVHAGARPERIGRELLLAQLGPIEITSGYSRSPDAEFARYARRQQPQMAVYDIQLGIINRLPDRYAAQRCICPALEVGYIHRSFGRTVQINQLRAITLAQQQLKSLYMMCE
ncbi:hypothetical protein D3C73_588010 [compost metagenome]